MSGKLSLSPVELIAAINLANAGSGEALDRAGAIDIINRIVNLTSELGGLGSQVERLGTEAWRAALDLANDTDSQPAAKKRPASSRRAMRTSAEEPNRG